MVTGHGLRWRAVLAAAVVAGLVGYLGLGWWVRQGGAFPQLSWVSALLLFFMGSGVFAAGLPVRRALRAASPAVPNPLRAVRTLVLAQACALTGAMVAGWYTAAALVLLPDADAASVRSHLVMALVLALCGAGLVGVGLWVQSVCRVKPPDDEGPQPPVSPG